MSGPTSTAYRSPASRPERMAGRRQHPAVARDTVHALRGWPTPLVLAVNTANELLDDAGRFHDPRLTEQVHAIASQLIRFQAPCGFRGSDSGRTPLFALGLELALPAERRAEPPSPSGTPSLTGPG